MVAKVRSTRKRSRRICLFSSSIFALRSSSAMSGISKKAIGKSIISSVRQELMGKSGDLSRRAGDANLVRVVTPVRLKSSFIYLANAVNDLRGNWSVLAVVLAPMLLLAALCLLPDALNLQYRLATTFEQGTQNISYVQNSHMPDAYAHEAQTTVTPKSAPLQEPQPFSPWITT